MVKEPFWLGLITVGTVLLIILMVYCVKRKFADKIEKFLADEIERSKNSKSPPTWWIRELFCYGVGTRNWTTFHPGNYKRLRSLMKLHHLIYCIWGKQLSWKS